MTLQNARLLIVVEKADYRPHLFNATTTGSQLVESLLAQNTDPQAMAAAPSSAITQPLSTVDLHILNAVAYWQSQLQDVAIFSAYSVLPYSVITPAGIRLIGSGIAPDSPELGRRQHNQLVADFCPTHIVFCVPAITVLRWASQNGIPSVALFWEWQEPLGRQQRRKHTQLIKLLNGPSVNWVGGLGLYACKVLETSGISASKLIPWEWSQQSAHQNVVHQGAAQNGPQNAAQGSQESFQTKQLRYDREAVELLYIGSVHDHAGITNLLNAVGHMQAQGTSVHLKLLYEAIAAVPEASQRLTELRSHITAHNLSAQVELIPLSNPHTTLQAARDADLIVIPSDLSHAADPSAPPLAIQLARAARTPIVAADCASLEGELFHGVNAMIFPAGNAKSMAHRIERLMSQPQLYAQISDALEVTLKALKIPARWTTLIDHWLSSADTMPAGKDNHQRLCNWAMSSGRYSQL